MRKENLILGGIFLLLLVLAFAYDPIMEWKKNLGRPDNFLKNIDFEEVVKVNLEKGGEKISLERLGDKWKISGTKDFFVRDKDELFTTYLEEAIESKLDLVSNNIDKKAEYETDGSGVRVSLEDKEKVLADFIIGKMTNDFGGSYVSLPGSQETYKINGNLNYAFSKNTGDWYDESIFSSEAESVNKIRFQYPNSEFSVEKVEDIWEGTLPYSFSVDQEKIANVLTIMTSLNAVDIPAQTFDGTGLEKHSIIVEASGDNLNNVLMVGDANADGSYFVKRGDSDNIYLITKEQKDALDTSIGGLR